MNKIYLDTNFLMDLLAREDENTIIATNVVEKGKRLNLKFYVSFLSVANFAYITRKQSKETLFSNLDLYVSFLTLNPMMKIKLFRQNI